MYNFEITKKDILPKFNQSFDALSKETCSIDISKFYEFANSYERRFILNPTDSYDYLTDERYFAFASLKSECIAKNWNNLIKDCNDLDYIKSLFDVYYKFHIKSTEGVSSNIVDKFRSKFEK